MKLFGCRKVQREAGFAHQPLGLDVVARDGVGGVTARGRAARQEHDPLDARFARRGEQLVGAVVAAQQEDGADAVQRISEGLRPVEFADDRLRPLRERAVAAVAHERADRLAGRDERAHHGASRVARGTGDEMHADSLRSSACE